MAAAAMLIFENLQYLGQFLTDIDEIWNGIWEHYVRVSEHQMGSKK